MCGIRPPEHEGGGLLSLSHTDYSVDTLKEPLKNPKCKTGV